MFWRLRGRMPEVEPLVLDPVASDPQYARCRAKRQRQDRQSREQVAAHGRHCTAGRYPRRQSASRTRWGGRLQPVPEVVFGVGVAVGVPHSGHRWVDPLRSYPHWRHTPGLRRSRRRRNVTVPQRADPASGMHSAQNGTPTASHPYVSGCVRITSNPMKCQTCTGKARLPLRICGMKAVDSMSRTHCRCMHRKKIAPWSALRCSSPGR
jgi:hypothetical protein